MILAHKEKNGNTTHWWYEGHAKTEICNGFSMLTCAFLEQIKKEERPCLKYVEERDKYEIFYDGNEGVAEEFYEGGISLLTDMYPEEVAFSVEYKDTSERR